MGGWEGVSEGGDICTLKADSRSCIAETNTTLQNNYPPTKNKFLKKAGGCFWLVGHHVLTPAPYEPPSFFSYLCLPTAQC